MGTNKKTGNKNNQQNKTAPKTPGQAPAARPAAAASAAPAGNQRENVTVLTEEKLKTLAATDAAALAKKSGTLSPDKRIEAFSLLERTVINPPDPTLAFPQEIRKQTNMLVAIGTVVTLMDHCANGDDSFALTMQKVEYAPLISIAKEAGYEIKFPEIKALPVNEEGKVTLAAKDVKISKEEKKRLQEEKKIREGKAPELDPEKITSEEDLNAALNYMFVQKRSVGVTGVLMEGVEFMKKFRMHEASLAENADKAKAKFESYNTGDWLDDLFSHVRPSVFFGGIGRGMAEVVGREKNPIHAFTILRAAIKNKETGELPLGDQEIAYCVKSIITWYCKTNIEALEETNESLDPKANKKDIVANNNRINDLNNIIDIITNPATDCVDTLLENAGHHTFENSDQLTDECQRANSIVNGICESYYGKRLNSDDYKNLLENVQQYAGYVINLFRAPGETSKVYSLNNIVALEEYTKEEKDALKKAAKAEKDAQEQKNA